MNEPKSTGELKDSANKILDATYKKADLSSNSENSCKQLNLHQKTELLNLLLEFQEFFDGTLGEQDTDPVSLELKKGAKLSADKLYPVLRSHKEALKKEVQRLCDIGVT